MSHIEPKKAKPTEAQAWNTLMRYEAQLNQHINTSPLKTAMQGYLNTFWDMSDHLAVDLTGFAFLFKDPRYRRLCQRWCWGPVAQLFSVDVFKKLKTSRLEGQWDYVLESFLDWVDSFAGGFTQDISFVECENILSCWTGDSGDEALEVYRQNIDRLFGRSNASGSFTFKRESTFLSGLSDQRYSLAYGRLSERLPEMKWDIPRTLMEIRERSRACRTVMLHVCFWYNPDLQEPLHKSQCRWPLRDHLRPVFAAADTSNRPHTKQDDDIEALSLQRTVVSFVVKNWSLMKSPEVFMRERLMGDEYVPYNARFGSEGWARLVCLLRNNFSIPFAHSGLVQFNGGGPLSYEDIQKSYDRGNESPFQLPITTPIEINDATHIEYTPATASSINGRHSTHQSEPDGHRRASSTSGASQNIAAAESRTRSAETPMKWKKDIIKQEELSSRSTLSRMYEQDTVPEGSTSMTRTASGPSEPPAPMTRLPSNHSPPAAQWSSQEPPAKRSRQENYTSSTIRHENQMMTNNQPLSSDSVPPPYTHPAPVQNPPSGYQPSNQQHSPPNPTITPYNPHQNQQTIYSSNTGPQIQPSFPSQPPQLTPLSRPQSSPSLASPSGPQANPSHPTQPLHLLPPPPSEPSPSLLPTPTRSASQSQASTGTSNTTQRFRILPPPSARSSSATLTPLNAEHKTKTEQAVELLQEAYGEWYAVDDLLRGITLLKDEVDAGIFLALKPGALRDGWLRRLMEKGGSSPLVRR